MSLKSALSKPFARRIVKGVNKWAGNPIETQQSDFRKLMDGVKGTQFGKDHGLGSVKTYNDFRTAVPVRDYEELRPYIDRILEGKSNILWRGMPIYWSKTSGTTSGVKYIPITKESISNHINSARNALLSYIAETGNAGFVNGKMIFLSGSPELDKKGGVLTGRLSGIVNHHVPGYLRKNQLPSYATNCIEDWEEKVDAIVDETVGKDMRLISGIPSWVQMYFERLQIKTGKETIREIFPNFSLFVHGGVNFEPYRSSFEKTIGFPIDTIELYPASEGFIAYQDKQQDDGLLLVLNSGIFYEFIPVDEFDSEDARRISLSEVELGVNYVIILNTNAGLWAYNIGDTVKFTSLEPYRIKVTGRIKHFISAFGEHVIAEEVEDVLKRAAEEFGAQIVEFTVAPRIDPAEGLPYHEWFIEFAKEPGDMDQMINRMDQLLQEQNIYYADLLKGNILRTLVVTPVTKNGFVAYMKSIGKLGGQNKVPRLSDDRKIADELSKFALLKR